LWVHVGKVAQDIRLRGRNKPNCSGGQKDGTKGTRGMCNSNFSGGGLKGASKSKGGGEGQRPSISKVDLEK